VDMSITQTFEMDVWSSFEPALKLADFPMYEGKEWNQTVTASMGGTYGGSIDAKGLPSMIEDSIHIATGQEFPMDITTIDLGGPFDSGKIKPQSDTDGVGLACRGTRQIKDENGHYMDVFLIGEPEDNYCEEYTNGYSDGYEEGSSDSSWGLDYDSTPPGQHSDGYDDGYQSGYFDGYYNWQYDDSCYYYPEPLPIYRPWKLPTPWNLPSGGWSRMSSTRFS